MKTNKSMVLGALSLLILAPSPVQAEEHIVQMLNRSKASPDETMVFEPGVVKAKVGDTVRFVLGDKFHNAEAISEIWPEGVEPLKGRVSEEAVLTVTKEGVYGVKCLPHYGLGMIALVVAGSPDLEKLKAMKFTGRTEKRMLKLIADVSK